MEGEGEREEEGYINTTHTQTVCKSKLLITCSRLNSGWNRNSRTDMRMSPAGQ